MHVLIYNLHHSLMCFQLALFYTIAFSQAIHGSSVVGE